MPFKLKGVKEMRAKLRQIAAEYPGKVAAALYVEAQIEVTEMKRRTPVDTTPNAPHPGQLRNSIHVLDPVINGSDISVTVATGANVAHYDIYVHEIPDNFHPIGQWKFMESVIMESRPYMAQRIAARIKF